MKDASESLDTTCFRVCDDLGGDWDGTASTRAGRTGEACLERAAGANEESESLVGWLLPLAGCRGEPLCDIGA